MRNLLDKVILYSLLLLLATVTTAISSEPQAGSAPQPSVQLEKEHDITLKILAAARQEVIKIRQTGTLNSQRILKMHDFFSNFVDKCHHAKEERFYFPAAKFYDGEVLGELITELINEHNYGRTLLQEVAYMMEQKETRDASLVPCNPQSIASCLSFDASTAL